MALPIPAALPASTGTTVRGVHPPVAPSLARGSYAGVFLVSLGTLMLEVLVTRIFSVTLWYHFAFVAISIAMLGLSAGAVVVYLFPRVFTPEKARTQMALFSILFAVATVASLSVHLGLGHWTPEQNVLRTVTFAVITTPFALSGVVICLALTKFPERLSRLYAADLCGAAIGCVLIIVLLDAIGDVFTVIALICGSSGLAAVCFAGRAGRRGLLAAGTTCALGFSALALVMAIRFAAGRPLVGVTWSKGQEESAALFERWNSYSRIKITGDPQGSRLALKIDGSAATAIRRFDGDPTPHGDLKNQGAAVIHALRPGASVAIIGVGGGQEMLMAHLFDQKPVVGIEMNADTVDALTREYGAFSGHLDRLPGFRLVNDEARSYLARSDQRFDIIMATMIDTWAATAAGAFVLTENSLYTVEAWRTFLEHLKPRGILSFTRWYTGVIPGEMYRLMSLATEALKAEGAAEPFRHIAILKDNLAGTIVVGKEPLSEDDLDTLEAQDKEKPYVLVHSPRGSTDPVFEQIARTGSATEALAGLPLDISAPTDDRPFFFNMVRFSLIPDSQLWSVAARSTVTANLEAVSILATLMLVVAGFVLLLIVGPLLLTIRRVDFSGAAPLLTYFAAIGLAFMLVEISQLQRLTIFLGHPTYGLSVVLFSLLLSSGIGSFSTAAIDTAAPRKASLRRLGLLLVVLSAFGAATPVVLHALRGASMPLRIAVAVLLLFPMGFFMGMAFPIGMKFAARRSETLTPWLWGVNGATSVFASVMAVAIALAAGITTTFWVGTACYVVAVLALPFVRGPSAQKF
jgi:spermidine synthase